ncbi:hypothetical protein QYF36_023348 [Acer negundo]|nr:hypothetical protein QYF36_023348 [Acer negundo]
MSSSPVRGRVQNRSSSRRRRHRHRSSSSSKPRASSIPVADLLGVVGWNPVGEAGVELGPDPPLWRHVGARD